MKWMTKIEDILRHTNSLIQILTDRVLSHSRRISRLEERVSELEKE